MSLKPIIVFIHGAWHTPECFNLVRAQLHHRGWATETVKNPSSGAASPEIGLYDDAANAHLILQRLCDEGKRLVIVAHSYGGCVASEAVQGLGYQQRAAVSKPGGVIMLNYMAALALPAGSSVIGARGGRPSPWWNIKEGFTTPDTPEVIFYQDVSPELTRKSIGTLQKQAYKAFQEAATYEPWHDINCSYLVADADKAIPAQGQEKIAAMMGPNIHVTHWSGGHSPFLAHPEWTADYLERIGQIGQDSPQL